MRFFTIDMTREEPSRDSVINSAVSSKIKSTCPCLRIF
ncbi:Uncharacterised protein [Vibrio cholerae]|nr:Uncharacterised protein [Vibrio cholerae]